MVCYSALPEGHTHTLCTHVHSMQCSKTPARKGFIQCFLMHKQKVETGRRSPARPPLPSAYITQDPLLLLQASASLWGRWAGGSNPQPSSAWTETRWSWRPRAPSRTQRSASRSGRSSKRTRQTTGSPRWVVRALGDNGLTCTTKGSSFFKLNFLLVFFFNQPMLLL